MALNAFNDMKTTKNEEQNSAPTYTSCAGKVRACVWESQESNGVRHKIIVSRLFKQKDSWQRGRTSYGDELAALVEAIGKAQRWIQTRHRQLEFPRQPAQTDN